MRITELRVTRCYAELEQPMRERGSEGFGVHYHTGSEKQWLTAVEVLTDEDTVGITAWPGAFDASREFVDDLAPAVLVGADPRAVRDLRVRLLMAGAARGLVNRMEWALWDLLAKCHGAPLFELLGGGPETGAQVYAGGGALCWNPLDDLVEEARQLKAQGFEGLKIKIGHGPEEDAEIVAAIREAVGPDSWIAVDANRAYDLRGALRLCDALAELDVAWFEEPFLYEDGQDYRRLREESAIPVAGGEGFAELSRVAWALENNVLDVLQCDCGVGLAELLAAAEMAAEHGVLLTPHSCNNAMGRQVAMHLHLTIPNRAPQEFETFNSPFIRELLDPPPELADGRMELGDAPGLGVSLNRHTLQRYAV